METDKEILQYIMNHSDEEDKLLSELSRKTHLETTHPRMLSGYLQGKLLEFLSKMIQPENILEIGTFTGYSAICLAKGLKKNGKLITLEINDEREQIISEFIKKAGFENKIQLIIGDASKLISKLNIMFDLIFIDADKPNYPKYYHLIKKKLKPGGYIIADNVLWSGKILKQADENDLSTSGIQKFNRLVKEDSDLEKLILPIRDGLTIIRKK